MRPIPTISVLLVLLTSLVHSIPRTASAAEPDNPWRVLFDRCQKLSNEGDYNAALEACERASELNSDPGILAYIVQIQIARLHPVEARETLDRYLHSGKLDEADRKTAEAQARYLDTLLTTLLVTTPLEAAETRVDDRVIAPSALARGIRLTAGAHRVTLQAKGATFSRFVFLTAGERTPIELPGNGTIALSCAAPQVRFFIDDRELDAAQAANGVPRVAGSHRVTFKVGATAQPGQPVMLNPDERVLVVCTPLAPAPAHELETSMNPRGFWVTGAGLTLGVAALATAIYNGSQYDKWQTANETLRSRSLTFEQSRQVAQGNEQLMESIQTTRMVAVSLGIASGLVTAGGVALLFTDSRKPTQNAHAPWLQKLATGLKVNGAWTSGEIAWRGIW